MKEHNNFLKKIKVSSLEAEQAVLGSLLLNNSCWDKISTLLVIKDFFYKIHKVIFSVILKLVNLNKLFDVISVYEKIKDLNITNFADYNIYLNNLIQNTPNPSNIIDYATTIHNMYILRKLLYINSNILSNIYSSKTIDINEILNKIELEIINVNKYYFRDKENIFPVSFLFDEVYKNIKLLHNNPVNISGISTGFIDLDNILSGIHDGELIIIAGRPSMGKTTFALNIVEYISFILKLPTIVFTMEMSSNQLVLRILSSVTNLNQHLLRTGNLSRKDLIKIKKIIKKNYFIKIFINESVNLTSSEINIKSKKIIRESGKLGLIVVDYLQLMNSSVYNHNRVMELSEISRSLKCLAKELDVPIIAISQLNRSLELRINKRPIMSDLRESGAIEQDADVILFIYRDEVYNKSTLDKGLAEIIIAKQRNGPIGSINLSFSENTLKFKNLELN